MTIASRAQPRARRIAGQPMRRGLDALRIASAALCFLAPALAAGPVAAQPFIRPEVVAPLRHEPAPEIRVVNLRAKRDHGVVRQQRDYSCGAAALATLLTHGLGDRVDEETILRQVIEPMSEQQLAALQKNGLSLRHLQLVADDRGHSARGARIRADQLGRLMRPVIVFIRPGGYPHFAVLKGVRNGRAYLADPSLGNVRMPLTRFVEQWADPNDPAGRGIVFAVERGDGLWPERYALMLDDEEPPYEADSILRLTDRNLPAALATPLR